MSPHIAELSKLKNLQQSLEKTENVLVEQISRIDNSSQISEFFKDNTSSRIAQVENLKSNVKHIVVPLRKVNNLVRKENIGNIDLKLVKKEMVEIQNNIHAIKNTTKTTLDLLKKEEEKLLEDMQVFEKKVEVWSKPIINFPKIYAPKKTSATTPENISPEVKEFMDFVAASGGHENGWAVDDHNLFLKGLSKTKDVQKLAEVLHTLLPDISKEEIIAHHKWYQRYNELKEKRKNAIQNWRNNKIKTNTKSPLESKRERNLMKSCSDYLKKDEQQQRIAAWKAEKRAQMLKRQEEKLQEELRRKELEKQQRQKHEQLKAEVNNWRYSKQAAEEEKKLRKAELQLREQENKAARANKMIKVFQTQDEILIQKKMQLRQSAPKTPEVEVVNIKHEAPRDSQRLFQPTRQWILRSYGCDNSESGNNKLSVQAIPKLGIPEWRKNIT